MAHEPRSNRLPSPGTGPLTTAVVATPVHLSLATRLAQAETLHEVLPFLHQQAVEATGGQCAVLFDLNPATGALTASSGYAVPALDTRRWIPHEADQTVLDDVFSRRAPTVIGSSSSLAVELMPRVNARSIVLVPIARGTSRLGLLAIGFSQPPDARQLRDELRDLPDTLLTTLELFRLRANEERRNEVRELADELIASVATSHTLDAGLEFLCRGANRLFAADRTSLWLHDRRARHLVLHTSSDATPIGRDVRVSTDDALSPAAVAMRQARAAMTDRPGEPGSTVVTVPLRGARRALGTLLFEGVRVEAGSERELLERADELGREVATAIESAQLIDAVRQARRELEYTCDSISHLVVVTDRRGRIVHVNQEFATRLRTTREALIDRPLSDCVGSALSAWIDALDADGGDNRSPAVCEIEDGVLDGTFIVSVSSVRDANGQPAGRVVIARDMATRQDADAEREELHKQLTQSEKLSALGQFVAGIAHELNNPLQSVLGHLELLRATGAFPRGLRQQMHTISREADRAAKIVRNLLVFAGSGRKSRRPVSVNAVLRRVVSLRQRACRVARIEIVRHYDERLPRIKSDPLMLHQVFLNMVVNAEQAIVATGRPGRIELSTAAADNDTRIIVTVRDSGQGIPADVMSHVFEPFYTTKDVGKGTGLGLAIAYGIVQDHGGEIAVANHPDGGAVFTVELPIGQ